ncbi:Sec-independent protein translocase protein tatA/E [Erwinia tracheiphila PSU-1]|nr:Sec-independent protein translocase protein tatA/E [Erwinia tracheiphila PSU-1]
MGGSISIGQLLIIAVIVVLLFGTNKLRSLGSDLGSSIKGFKKAMSDDDDKEKNMPMMRISMPGSLKSSRQRQRKKTLKMTRYKPCSI